MTTFDCPLPDCDWSVRYDGVASSVVLHAHARAHSGAVVVDWGDAGDPYLVVSDDDTD